MLTACGIETCKVLLFHTVLEIKTVATVLTACGIETGVRLLSATFFSKLQQCLPLAVLKQIKLLCLCL